MIHEELRAIRGDVSMMQIETMGTDQALRAIQQTLEQISRKLSP